LGAEHLKKANVLNRTARAMRDKRLNECEFIGSQQVLDLLYAITARQLVDSLDLGES